MSKIVPLVVYRNGRKDTIGTAEIADDGTITSHITDPEIAKELQSTIGQFSIVPKDPARTDMCWNCAMGRCNTSEGDNSCFCCLNDHKII
jgi:hypothetical protein